MNPVHNYTFPMNTLVHVKHVLLAIANHMFPSCTLYNSFQFASLANIFEVIKNNFVPQER